ETEERFKKRINALAQEVEDDYVNMKGERWVIGKNQRDFGSIHSDYWIGTAAELSTCNMFTVYPVTGWWKERTNLKKVETKTRYSLIISLETEQENVELYTTILNKVKVPIKIST
ncbi:MAG TPA: hypothetical protein VLB84_00775, partial [Bacteroidia bacterium]|nr:hypothetical protein [Bacteroidia bacterium]